jgi:hypothetical protein
MEKLHFAPEQQLFTVLLRMAWNPMFLLDKKHPKQVIMAGSMAMTYHMNDQQFTYFMTHRDARTDNIDLRVPHRMGKVIATNLLNAMNTDVLHAFGQNQPVSHLYMLEYVMKLKGDDNIGFEDNAEYSVMQNGLPPDKLFSLYCRNTGDGHKLYQIRVNATRTILATSDAPTVVTPVTFGYIDLTEMNDAEWSQTLVNSSMFDKNRIRVMSSLQLRLELETMDRESLRHLNDKRWGMKVKRDNTRKDIMNGTYISPVSPTYTVVDMALPLYTYLSNLHTKCLNLSKLTIPLSTVKTLVDPVYAYTANSSKYNVACMISKYTGSEPTGAFPISLENSMAGVTYTAFTAALKRAALQVYCGTNTDLLIPYKGKGPYLKLLNPLQKYPQGWLIKPDDATKCGMSRANQIQALTTDTSDCTRFTVYRAVDYFQLLNTTDIYTVQLPFRIVNFTQSSTSIDSTVAHGFLPKMGYGCILVLNVPYYFRRFIAVSSMSKYPDENEILFPDDAVFEIHHRYFKTNHGIRTLYLVGNVTSTYYDTHAAMTSPCFGIKCKSRVTVNADGGTLVANKESTRQRTAPEGTMGGSPILTRTMPTRGTTGTMLLTRGTTRTRTMPTRGTTRTMPTRGTTRTMPTRGTTRTLRNVYSYAQPSSSSRVASYRPHRTWLGNSDAAYMPVVELFDLNIFGKRKPNEPLLSTGYNVEQEGYLRAFFASLLSYRRDPHT